MEKMLRIGLVFLVCLLLPGFAGMIMNMINSAVRAEYFIKILRWENVKDISSAAIAQGMYQGIIEGSFFSLLFSCVYVISNKAELALASTIKWIVCMGIAAFALWAIGGIIAVALAMLSPEFYRQSFIGVPDEFGAMLRYAWVGGSIWGGTFGGIAVMAIGAIMFRNANRQGKEKKG
jgi:hypothetical protein